MSGPIDIAALAGILADRIDSLVIQLLPAGVREGAEWRIGSVAGEPGRSMAVHLGGVRSGVWSDFSTGERGDALDLVAAVLFGGEKGRAIQWSRAWLGLDSSNAASFAAQRRAATERRNKASEEDRARQRRAAAIFLAAKPSLTDTPAATYLASRAIDLGRLARQPRSLRFHPSLWNEESQRHWPALVAAITNGEGRMVGVHRTWLQPDDASKAPLRDPKMTLGRYAGGSIRLWRGSSGKPFKDAPPGEEIVVTEGIEDGLTVALAATERRVIAAVSLANIGNLELSTVIGNVIIMAQNDPPESPAACALDRAVAALQRRGRRIKIARPPAGIKDANDLWRASRGAA